MQTAMMERGATVRKHVAIHWTVKLARPLIAATESAAQTIAAMKQQIAVITPLTMPTAMMGRGAMVRKHVAIRSTVKLAQQ